VRFATFILAARGPRYHSKASALNLCVADRVWSVRDWCTRLTDVNAK
jgi:hypothetical protein